MLQTPWLRRSLGEDDGQGDDEDDDLGHGGQSDGLADKLAALNLGNAADLWMVVVAVAVFTLVICIACGCHRRCKCSRARKQQRRMMELPNTSSVGTGHAGPPPACFLTQQPVTSRSMPEGHAAASYATSTVPMGIPVATG